MPKYSAVLSSCIVCRLRERRSRETVRVLIYPASSCATGWEGEVAEGSATSELRGLVRETALASSDAGRRRTAGWAGPTLSLVGSSCSTRLMNWVMVLAKWYMRQQ
jgi:hypothetical protein